MMTAWLELRALLDRSRQEILRQVREAPADVDESKMIAIVLHESVSPDGWPMTIVAPSEADARLLFDDIEEWLPGIFRLHKTPFAVVIARVGVGGVLSAVYDV